MAKNEELPKKLEIGEKPGFIELTVNELGRLKENLEGTPTELYELSGVLNGLYGNQIGKEGDKVGLVRINEDLVSVINPAGTAIGSVGVTEVGSQRGKEKRNSFELPSGATLGQNSISLFAGGSSSVEEGFGAAPAYTPRKWDGPKIEQNKALKPNAEQAKIIAEYPILDPEKQQALIEKYRGYTLDFQNVKDYPRYIGNREIDLQNQGKVRFFVLDGIPEINKSTPKRGMQGMMDDLELRDKLETLYGKGVHFEFIIPRNKKGYEPYKYIHFARTGTKNLAVHNTGKSINQPIIVNGGSGDSKFRQIGSELPTNGVTFRSSLPELYYSLIARQEQEDVVPDDVEFSYTHVEVVAGTNGRWEKLSDGTMLEFWDQPDDSRGRFKFTLDRFEDLTDEQEVGLSSLRKYANTCMLYDAGKPIDSDEMIHRVTDSMNGIGDFAKKQASPDSDYKVHSDCATLVAQVVGPTRIPPKENGEYTDEFKYEYVQLARDKYKNYVTYKSKRRLTDAECAKAIAKRAPTEKELDAFNKRLRELEAYNNSYFESLGCVAEDLIPPGPEYDYRRKLLASYPGSQPTQEEREEERKKQQKVEPKLQPKSIEPLTGPRRTNHLEKKLTKEESSYLFTERGRNACYYTQMDCVGVKSAIDLNEALNSWVSDAIVYRNGQEVNEDNRGIIRLEPGDLVFLDPESLDNYLNTHRNPIAPDLPVKTETHYPLKEISDRAFAYLFKPEGGGYYTNLGAIAVHKNNKLNNVLNSSLGQVYVWRNGEIYAEYAGASGFTLTKTDLVFLDRDTLTEYRKTKPPTKIPDRPANAVDRYPEKKINSRAADFMFKVDGGYYTQFNAIAVRQPMQLNVILNEQLEDIFVYRDGVTISVNARDSFGVRETDLIFLDQKSLEHYTSSQKSGSAAPNQVPRLDPRETHYTEKEISQRAKEYMFKPEGAAYYTTESAIAVRRGINLNAAINRDLGEVYVYSDGEIYTVFASSDMKISETDLIFLDRKSLDAYVGADVTEPPQELPEIDLTGEPGKYLEISSTTGKYKVKQTLSQEKLVEILGPEKKFKWNRKKNSSSYLNGGDTIIQWGENRKKEGIEKAYVNFELNIPISFKSGDEMDFNIVPIPRTPLPKKVVPPKKYTNHELPAQMRVLPGTQVDLGQVYLQSAEQAIVDEFPSWAKKGAERMAKNLSSKGLKIHKNMPLMVTDLSRNEMAFYNPFEQKVITGIPVAWSRDGVGSKEGSHKQMIGTSQIGRTRIASYNKGATWGSQTSIRHACMERIGLDRIDKNYSYSRVVSQKEIDKMSNDTRAFGNDRSHAIKVGENGKPRATHQHGISHSRMDDYLKKFKMGDNARQISSGGGDGSWGCNSMYQQAHKNSPVGAKEIAEIVVCARSHGYPAFEETQY